MLKGKGILSPFQIEFLKLFAGLADQRHFYLTGGTALAEYYLVTSEADLVLPFSYQLEQSAIQAGYGVTIVRRFASFVEFQISQGEEKIKIDLALDSAFRLAAPELGDYGVLVNDFVDIQADKTLAFFGRAEPRDAIDLYFLLKKTSFDELANLARQKDTGFDLYWFGIALNRTASFPDEIERWPVKMLIDFDPIDLKRSFQVLSTEIINRMT
jgi:hypothetical protein